ncbi:MAG: pyridoxamine 5'-phosphate oxidase family protein [Acidimicrobiales bacterium]
MVKPVMEVLGTDQCTELLRQVPVGRVAITVDALPVVLPVNFAVVDDTIVFLTIPGTKLTAATANAVVAFEVDSYEADGRSGWSVVVQGIASEVTDSIELEKILAVGIESWALDGQADHAVRIELHTLSGRRFTS